MLALERQNAIMDLLLDQKSVMIADLADKFNVSYETIRRDLKALERETGIERTYGGAVLQDPQNRNFSYANVSRFMKETKNVLAQKALSFIKKNECIFIDFSTTCFPIAQLISNIHLRLLTNSIDISLALTEKQNINVFLLGGYQDVETHGLFGPTTINNFTQFNLDKSFISCRSISIEHGLSDRTEEESILRSTAIKMSKEIYLLMDYSKFGWDAFTHTEGLEKVTAIITDKPLDEEWMAFFNKRGIAVYCEVLNNKN